MYKVKSPAQETFLNWPVLGLVETPSEENGVERKQETRLTLQSGQVSSLNIHMIYRAAPFFSYLRILFLFFLSTAGCFAVGILWLTVERFVCSLLHTRMRRKTVLVLRGFFHIIF